MRASAAASDAPVAVQPTPATPSANPQVLVTGTAAAAPIASAPPVTAATPVPFTDQIVGPLARLREAPEGTHVLTVHVTPEDLGPVRVRAHITGEGVRIELLGVTDASREALRVALTDLRRDLAATGLNADLQLGQDRGDRQSGLQAGGQGPGEERGRAEARLAHATRGETEAAPSSTSTLPSGAPRAGGIDLFA
ncbi:flagellar hook-length control protein FliK [Georgenia thermotolerans]|uniref:flagellar hook-length control protein FliK n=1 Tax=Georgenia thermotolerans TaxID=527326 RepID=UPI00186B01E4|nr:flagellar hook-length control protein FliK [Georgenia thermotolerans]